MGMPRQRLKNHLPPFSTRAGAVSWEGGGNDIGTPSSCWDPTSSSGVGGSQPSLAPPCYERSGRTGSTPRRSAATHIVKVCTGARVCRPHSGHASASVPLQMLTPPGGGDYVAAVSVTGTYSGVNISGRKGPRKGLLTREGQNISQGNTAGEGTWHVA